MGGVAFEIALPAATVVSVVTLQPKKTGGLLMIPPSAPVTTMGARHYNRCVTVTARGSGGML